MAQSIINYVSGNGGFISLFPTTQDQPPDFGDEVRIEVGDWTGAWACEYIAATPAGSGAGTLMLPKIGMHQWQATFPLDPTQAVPLLDETIGDHYFDAGSVDVNNGFTQVFTVGMPIYEMYFRRGGEAWRDGSNNLYSVYDLLERTTVTDVQMITNSADALRVVLRGMGGRLTQGYTILNT